DVGRLDERVRKLASHFGQVEKDIDDIQTSTRKITSRGNRITQIDVGEEEAPPTGLPVERD
ncbi:MAG: DNA recombination protein RmuC, partial [Pseudomonadota bacterium]|nr:DNA recombination protein RmuC [Pseudomonadota bacterium]